MFEKNKRAIFTVFFLSGFCSLVYQIVWMRLAFTHFGVITPVMSIVVSVFMLGLCLGSWLGGKFIDGWVERTRSTAAHFYVGAELLIGLGAFFVPSLFAFGAKKLLSTGEMDSFSYLFWSALLISATLLPWCVAMGTTFPFMMSFIKRYDSARSTKSFSFLYLSNVLGAMAGSVSSAVLFIELLGFRNTLFIAAIGNLIIALIALKLARKAKNAPTVILGSTVNSDALPASSAISPSSFAVLLVSLVLTGFASMSLEIIWTRNFTPVLRTTIYSFAWLLFTYLAATWAGSQLYRRELARGSKGLSTSTSIGLAGLASFGSMLLSDPRLGLGSLGALASIFPFCAILGYLTPKLIDQYSQGSPKRAGYAYALNIVGCILGPLAATYFLLPAFGVLGSMIILTSPFFLLYLIASRRESLKHRLAIVVASVLGFVLCLGIAKSYEDAFMAFGPEHRVMRDHSATVVANGSGRKKMLYVNGVGITELTPVTKFMAHFPLAYRERKPESALVICFGMGTTFRSLLTWDIKATAVELIPSVKTMFSYFHEDAGKVTSNPRGQIVVDDGRRFLQRTSEKFDVITLDPPPPVEAAASSLLYSEEFYSLVKSRLKPDGILQQWFPFGEEKTLNAIIRSLVNSFPYVRAYSSMDDWGFHFIASQQPLGDPTLEQLISRIPQAARADMLEWNSHETLEAIFKRVLAKELVLETRMHSNPAIVVTDDRPYNEYFLLRRIAANLKGRYDRILRKYFGAAEHQASR
ncbi:MAG: fused MFS/spermidine synthase [Bdellovibrionota bacterium]